METRQKTSSRKKILITRIVLLSILAGVLVFAFYKPPKRPNVILIVLDAVRYDGLSCNGNPRPTSPVIDGIAAEGMRFTQAYANGPWTVPSHASMFTSLYPSQHQAHWRNPCLAEKHLTLAEHLAANGYFTASISANPYISPLTSLDHGFEKAVLTFKRSDILNQSVSSFFLRRDEVKPFFLFLNLMNAHVPCQPSREVAEVFLPEGVSYEQAMALDQGAVSFYTGENPLGEEEFRMIRALYEAEIRSMDQWIGGLLHRLRGQQLLENTILIITSDHGENQGEHGLIDHQYSVHETLLHVPLILCYPRKIKTPEVVEDLVELVDIFPTVIDLCGVPEPRGHVLEGRNLMSRRERVRPYAIAEYRNKNSTMGLEDNMRKGWLTWFDNAGRSEIERVLEVRKEPCFVSDMFVLRAGTHKFVRMTEGEDALYDLSRDPDERENLASLQPELTDRFRGSLEAWLKANTWTIEGEPPAEIDPEVERQLRSLGYL